MKTTWRTGLSTSSLCVLVALLAGCSAGSGNGLGKAGKQSAHEPRAVITPIGHVAEPDGVLRVRSGAEVVLSAKDSEGRDSAILAFEWAPANAAAEGVKLYERGASAVSFRAPLPPDSTPQELRFRLTVRTADGNTGSSEIRVLVGRVPDPDDFLLSDITNSADGVNLVLIPTATQNQTSLAADLHFTISIEKRVHYNRAHNAGSNPSANPAANDPVYCQADTAGGTNTCVKTGPPVVLDSAWLASSGIYGPGAAGYTFANLVRAYQNPHFRIRPPVVNADEVNFAVLSGGLSSNATGVAASDARRDNLLFTADIDSARAEYLLTLAPGAGAATLTTALVVMATSTNPGAVDGLVLASLDIADMVGGPATVVLGDGVLGTISTAGVVDSRATAQAYYDAIDPPGAGFPDGRRSTVDDWLRDNCLQPGLLGNYGADLNATYLNDRDLGFGREMYFKTNCMGGQQAATGATIDTAAGERAAIVFNYPSLEAALKRTGAFLAVAMEYRADTAGGIPYTRFYTFAPDPRTRSWKRVLSANFDGRGERYMPGNCTVCHGGKPKAGYASGADLGATFIPFDPKALLFADTDASIVDKRIEAGFTYADQEPRIRALNEQGVLPILQKRKADTQPAADRLARWDAALEVLSGWYPSPGTASNYDYVPLAWRSQVSPNSVASSEDIYLKVVAQNCRMCHLQRITDAAANAATLNTSGAPQFGSFAELDGVPGSSVKVRQRVFDEQLMPASRLTADRFWLPLDGQSQSAAQILAAHFGLSSDQALPRLRALASGPAEVEPGTAQESGVRLSGRGSLLASSYEWTLERPAGSSAVLVGANTAEPAFRADVSGTYRAFLTVTDAAGTQDQLDDPVVIVGDARPRTPANWSVIVPAVDIGKSLFQLFQANGVTLGEGRNTLMASTSIPNAALTYPSYCTNDPNDLPGYGGNCKITFKANASGVINYTFTDADGDTASGAINVTVNIPGGWDVNRAPVGTSCIPGNSICENPTRYVRSCQAPCGGALAGINPTLLAQQALNLDASTFSSLNYSVAVTPSSLVTTASGRSTGGVVGAGSKGSATASSTGFNYSAPNLFVTSQGNQIVPDSFQFQVVVRNSSGTAISTSQTGTVYMTVTPRTTWATVLDYLKNAQAGAGSGYACASCHGAARDTASGRGWGSLTADPGGSTTYEDLAGSRRTECPVAGGPSGAPADPSSTTPKCVDFTNPSSSLLRRKPLGEYDHGEPTYNIRTGETPVWTSAGHSTQLEAILNWILDGAYQN